MRDWFEVFDKFDKRQKCTAPISSSNIVTPGEYGHLGRHCDESLFLLGTRYEQARTPLLLLLVMRDHRSVFPLDDNKHIKHHLHDDKPPAIQAQNYKQSLYGVCGRLPLT